VSRDESRYTLEFDDMYLIQPVHPWWDTSTEREGSPMPEGAKFSSDTNEWWLQGDQLLDMLEDA
jgi:UDP-N-acetylglucosamine 4,6-dehydratase